MVKDNPVFRKPKPDQVPIEMNVPVLEKKDQKFSDFINTMRKKNEFKLPKSCITKDKDNGRDWLTIKDIAICLGMNFETCRKWINQDKSKGKDHRDFVIALSMILDLNVVETNEALELYYDTSKLHEESPRDACLIKIIDDFRLRSGRDVKKKPYYDPQKMPQKQLHPIPLDKRVEYADHILLTNKHDKLDIVRERTRKKQNTSLISKEQTLKSTAENDHTRNSLKNHEPALEDFPYDQTAPIYITNVVFPDIYNDLESEYSLWRYSTTAKMTVCDKSGKKKYTLSANSQGELKCKPYSSRDSSDSLILPTYYSSPDDAGDFNPFFLELKSAAQKGWEHLLLHLDDTRNYYERLGGGILGDRIHIFVERYNYCFSERNEFFVTEYINGKHRFSIFRRSVFMTLNLREEEYFRYYRKNMPSPIFVFQSDEDFIKHGCSQFLPIYDQMKRKIDTTLELLRSKQKYVRNLNEIWDRDQDRVCSWFNVENKFKCKTRYFRDPYMASTEIDQEILAAKKIDTTIANIEAVDSEISESDALVNGYDECYIEPGVYQAEFKMEDGISVMITTDDLKRAFELGFTDIDQVCHVKREKGSIEAVLE